MTRPISCHQSRRRQVTFAHELSCMCLEHPLANLAIRPRHRCQHFLQHDSQQLVQHWHEALRWLILQFRRLNLRVWICCIRHHLHRPVECEGLAFGKQSTKKTWRRPACLPAVHAGMKFRCELVKSCRKCNRQTTCYTSDIRSYAPIQHEKRLMILNLWRRSQTVASWSRSSLPRSQST